MDHLYGDSESVPSAPSLVISFTPRETHMDENVHSFSLLSHAFPAVERGGWHGHYPFHPYSPITFTSCETQYNLQLIKKVNAQSQNEAKRAALETGLQLLMIMS